MSKTMWDVGEALPKASYSSLPKGQAKASLPWQMRGFTDANLFVHAERATLTFYYQGTVASIHFDRARGEIFFKGHQVKNFKLNQEEWHWLQEFGRCLQDQGASPALVSAYENCLQEVLPKR